MKQLTSTEIKKIITSKLLKYIHQNGIDSDEKYVKEYAFKEAHEKMLARAKKTI